MKVLALSALLGVLTACAVLAAGCYNHNQPNVNCAANPHGEGCYPPVHDRRKPDGGR